MKYDIHEGNQTLDIIQFSDMDWHHTLQFPKVEWKSSIHPISLRIDCVLILPVLKRYFLYFIHSSKKTNDNRLPVHLIGNLAPCLAV